MIFFVDDEKRRMEIYIKELRLSGYEVEIESDVDSALDFLGKNHEKIELLILDVMMPAGKAFEDINTKYGLRTGISFYEKIRKENSTLPIIIFANVSDEEVEKKINSNCNSLFLQKEDFLPFQFVEEIKEFLRNK
jgi:CheY-like chemotaxis protein